MPGRQFNGPVTSKIPYDTSADALLNPARNAVFFQGWEPDVDNQNHDLLCAEMSRLAYAGQEVVIPALARIGFSAVGFIGGDDPATRFEMHGTEGFVAKNPAQGLTVLAFRGTESNKFDDLISDLDTLQRDFRDGRRVHTGFLKAYGPLVQQRVTTLLQDREGSLLVTGHSLGAALATLAALDTNPTALITFGSPRVGDAQFARLFNGLTVHRFVNCCDVVARIPPEQFDHGHLRQLLTELGDFERFTPPGPLLANAAADLAARGLAAAFRGVAPENKFMHISPPRYVRADGTVAEEISDKQILENQLAARTAYRHSTENGLEQVRQLFDSLRAASRGQAPLHVGRLLRNIVRGLLNLVRGDPVPLRDLADHAPINYVSAFTGRVEAAGQL